MNLEGLCSDDLKRALGNMRAGSSCGVDGWRVVELQRLPAPLLARLAVFFNMVEATGAWPQALQKALVSFIPKPEGHTAKDMRPITVMSAVYRLWAAARLGRS